MKTVVQLRTFGLFVIGGLINTAISYAAYLLLEPHVGFRVAYFLAYVVGVLFSYFFTSRIVFKRHLSWRSFFAFPLVYVFQYLVGGAMLEVLVRWVHIDKTYAPLFVAVFMLPVTYVLSKFVLNKTSRKMERNTSDW